jgi:hypothetical protein
MPIAFRKFEADTPVQPAPGEVFVKRNPVHAKAPPGLASLVLEHGLAALLCGPGQPECLVLDAGFTSPTFDEMLAAGFAQRLLETPERPLPDGCASLARYAALLLRGHRPPGPVAPEDSIEGVYQAIRNGCGTAGGAVDLTVPAVADHFLARWKEMETCLLRAAAADANFHAVSPFANNPAFDVERAFLAADRRKYRIDVNRGQRWRVSLPGTTGPEGGLLLHRPESLLFKHWAREDTEAPGGAGYLFLAIDWGEGRWVFSTDPARRLSIASLAEPLQQREARRDQTRAQGDPWYDGHRPEHAGTLVASPRKGTLLSERQVLRAVKRWAGVRRVVPSGGRMSLSGMPVLLVLLVLLGGGAAAAWKWREVVTPDTSRQQGLVATPDESRGQPVETYYADKGRWMGIGLEEPADSRLVEAHKQARIESRTPAQGADGAGQGWRSRLKVVLRSPDGPLADIRLGVAVNGDNFLTASRLPGPAANEAVFLAGDFDFRPRGNSCRFEIDNPSDADRNVYLRAETLPRALYVLAVGISDYDRLPSLPRPRNDPPALADAFAAQKALGLFSAVHVRQVVSAASSPSRDRHPETSREAVYEGLGWLHREAQACDMAVIVLSGHGDRDDSGHYLFAPSNYEPDNKGKHGVPGVELLREMSNLKCPTLLVLDTCHSGAVASGALPHPPRAMLILASTLASEESRASDEWDGHGPLVLALLEALGNRRLVEPKKGTAVFAAEDLRDGLVTWANLRAYAGQRMSELLRRSDGRQAFQDIPGPDTRYGEFPIAVPPAVTGP